MCWKWYATSTLLLDCWLYLLCWLSLLLWKYLCRHHMCLVLDVFRPRKRLNQRLEEMLRLGLRWVLASCSWLSLGFWRPCSKKPYPGLVYPIILFKTPTEGLALQGWRHILQLPQALAKFAVANHQIWSYTAIDKFAISGFVPPSISHCQALRSVFLHEYSHWNAKFDPANPPMREGAVWSL